jgi:hypothetical protein
MSLKPTKLTATVKDNPNLNTTLKTKTHLGVSQIGSVGEVEARVLGIPGETGSPGIIWFGTYNSTQQYRKNDAVFYNGSSFVYISDTPTSDNTPADNQYWDYLAQGGTSIQPNGIEWVGEYNPLQEYAETDAVYYNGESFIYVNQTPTTGNTPADNQYWDYLAKAGDGFSWQGEFNSATLYKKNDVVNFDGTTFIYINNTVGIIEIPTYNSTTWDIFTGLPEMRIEIDELQNGDFYVGKSLPDSQTSEYKWAIKIVKFINNDISIVWANQESSFDKSWDLRATYTY